MSQGSKAADPANPCPFLRALAAGQYIHPELESIRRVAEIIGEAGGTTAPEKTRIRFVSKLIAAIANGLGLKSIMTNYKEGLHISRLRQGPLYKKGVSSRIIGEKGEFNEQEFERLHKFARNFPSPGGSELGLSLKEINTMMDENFARASHRRPMDRKLMNGEWPILLKIMKKGEGDDAYLSLAELRLLFADRKLPPRITERIESYRLSKVT